MNISPVEFLRWLKPASIITGSSIICFFVFGKRLAAAFIADMEGNRWTEQIFDQEDIVEIACNDVQMILYEDAGLPPR